ncbi:MAG: hypothetical protein V4675_03780 [Verrucomicrobiota bacterium]
MNDWGGTLMKGVILAQNAMPRSDAALHFAPKGKGSAKAVVTSLYLFNNFDKCGSVSAISKPIRVQLYLPSQDKEGRPLAEFDQLTHEISVALAKKFGGITRYAATGYFVNFRKSVEWESIQIIEFSSDELTWEKEGLGFLRLTVDLATGLHQEAVAYCLNGVMTLLYPAPPVK